MPRQTDSASDQRRCGSRMSGTSNGLGAGGEGFRPGEATHELTQPSTQPTAIGVVRAGMGRGWMIDAAASGLRNSYDSDPDGRSSGSIRSAGLVPSASASRRSVGGRGWLRKASSRTRALRLMPARSASCCWVRAASMRRRRRRVSLTTAGTRMGWCDGIRVVAGDRRGWLMPSSCTFSDQSMTTCRRVGSHLGSQRPGPGGWVTGGRGGSSVTPVSRPGRARPAGTRCVTPVSRPGEARGTAVQDFALLSRRCHAGVTPPVLELARASTRAQAGRARSSPVLRSESSVAAGQLAAAPGRPGTTSTRVPLADAQPRGYSESVRGPDRHGACRPRWPSLRWPRSGRRCCASPAGRQPRSLELTAAKKERHLW